MAEKQIIERDRSIIPACDFHPEIFKNLLVATKDIDAVGAYKIGGCTLNLRLGLERIVQIARSYTDKPLIYDHQKAATDIPALGKVFMEGCKGAGIDAVILFPQSGPATLEAWVKAAQEQELGVIVGGLMTHERYKRSEGGYIADEAILEIYRTAAQLGVQNFVVPGNKPGEIRKIKQEIEREPIAPTFYAPGFVEQKGKISEAAKVSGSRWHAIVGRGIYWNKQVNIDNTMEEMREAAEQLTSQL